MTIATPLTRLLGIEHPILLAPMGDVAGGRLAAAVSVAGGLGLIGGGYADPHWVEVELGKAGDARVGIGFITFALDERPDALRVALDAHPVAVQLSFGDPRPYVEAIHAAGALVFSQVQTVTDARRAQDAGVDVIVAQGQDSGGHGRPGRGTFALVPAIVDAVHPTPVVAAGGIGDGRGLAAALMLGASGVALGTRFYASAEALSDPEAAAGLVAAGGDDTVRTSVFDVVRGPAWPPGHDGRAVRNRLIERWHDQPEAVITCHPEAVDEYAAARDEGYSVKPLWAGEGLDLISGIAPAKAIVDRIVADASGLLAGERRTGDRSVAAGWKG
jgi:nitronate monooxygenase